MANHKKQILLLTSALLIALPDIILACDKCFGAGVDTPVTQGISLAMMALLGITGSVLGGITAFFLFLRRRAKMFESGEIMMTEKGEIINHPGLLRDIKKD